MDGYLLDTCLFSELMNPDKPHHAAVKQLLQSVEDGAPRYLSTITLGELGFGVRMAESCRHIRLPDAQATLKVAAGYNPLPVSRHTADAYARLRQQLAARYLKSGGCVNRPRWIEDWIDRTPEKRLQLDENDLWLCALAVERNLVMLTVDSGMDYIADAAPGLLRVRRPVSGALGVL